MGLNKNNIKVYWSSQKLWFIVFAIVVGINIMATSISQIVTHDNLEYIYEYMVKGSLGWGSYFAFGPAVMGTVVSIPYMLNLSVSRKEVVKTHLINQILVMAIVSLIVTVLVVIFSKLNVNGSNEISFQLGAVKINNYEYVANEITVLSGYFTNIAFGKAAYIFISIFIFYLSISSILIWITSVFLVHGVVYGLSNIFLILGIYMLNLWKTINIARFGFYSWTHYLIMVLIIGVLSLLSYRTLNKIEINH